jgi:hypothetical protein
MIAIAVPVHLALMAHPSCIHLHGAQLPLSSISSILSPPTLSVFRHGRGLLSTSLPVLPSSFRRRSPALNIITDETLAAAEE